MHVTQQEQQQINELVAQAEAKSGAQLLVVVVAKADAYPEIPWKAFAIAVAFTGLLAAAAVFFRPDWLSARSGLEAAVILGTGALFALITIFAPPFARLFLHRPRAEAEVRQYAQTVFLERGVRETRRRVGMLLLLARFEREVVILPDIGIRRHLSAAQIEAVIAEMKPLLARRRIAAACEAGLNALAKLLQDRLKADTSDNELPDALVEERGA